MRGPLATTTRHWLLLRSVPRAPRKVDTATLARVLAAQGIVVARRSVQRDLQQLSALFPLVCDGDTKPYGWSWARDAEPMDLPAMDPRTAMTFRLVGTYLAHLLPRGTWRELGPHLDRADSVLRALEAHNPLARWPEKVRVVPDGVRERPPGVVPEVLDAVYDALLHETRLRLRYRPRRRTRPRDYVVSPLGLVFRGPLAYLVSASDDGPPVTFALSRATHAERIDAPRTVPGGFDLDAFVGRGEPGFLLSPEPVRLVARVRRDAAQRLIEAPPGSDPEVTEADDHVLVRTTLPDTRPFRAWLLGFGSALEVLEPSALREALAAELGAAAAAYAGHR